jgi:hypothetical protein
MSALLIDLSQSIIVFADVGITIQPYDFAPQQGQPEVFTIEPQSEIATLEIVGYNTVTTVFPAVKYSLTTAINLDCPAGQFFKQQALLQASPYLGAIKAQHPYVTAGYTWEGQSCTFIRPMIERSIITGTLEFAIIRT